MSQKRYRRKPTLHVEMGREFMSDEPFVHLKLRALLVVARRALT
ncbi:hypothetical protein [Paludisphaera soli]|nr:hypothetical protein [Paludisphaera soli]